MQWTNIAKLAVCPDYWSGHFEWPDQLKLPTIIWGGPNYWIVIQRHTSLC
jgi:hypothetical protein